MECERPVTGGPCWTELGTSDLEAAKAFYTELFGWRPEADSRQTAGAYAMAYLGEAPIATLTPLYHDSQPVAWSVSFSVAHADTAGRAVTEAGGTVVVGPTEVFDYGRFAVAADPSGATFQLWQPRTFEGAGLLNAPGTLGWVELLTRDPERARAFYRDVFGWTVSDSARYPRWGVAGGEFGGMMTMDDKFPPEVPPHWLPYFVVTDVDASAAVAADAGGVVLMAPTTVPDGPRIAVLRDPQGAMFGVYVRDGRG
ncbi:VOC family protein [Streptomyces sp. NPDC088387]|uniref:VOC family protein n=1 Tax=Streptomyces sp. NPDC088387 TaxID=3365859 RepID=UPI0038198499